MVDIMLKVSTIMKRFTEVTIKLKTKLHILFMLTPFFLLRKPCLGSLTVINMKHKPDLDLGSIPRPLGHRSGVLID